MLVPVRAARRPPQHRAAVARQRFGVQHGGRQLVRVVEAPHGETVADQADHSQQDRAHEDESQHAAQHDLQLSHRLGHHGVQRAVADVARQAQCAEDQREEHREVDREVQHHLDVELGRMPAVALDEQGGEKDQHHEHYEDHHHPAAKRLADRQPRQGENPAERRAGDVRGNPRRGRPASPRAPQGPSHDHQHQPTTGVDHARQADHYSQPRVQRAGRPLAAQQGREELEQGAGNDASQPIPRDLRRTQGHNRQHRRRDRTEKAPQPQ